MAIPPEIINKRIRMSIVGQSNEVGFGPHRHHSDYGAPYSDDMDGLQGGWWSIALDKLWQESKVWCDIANTAKGGSGIVDDWCHDSVGDGTGTPYNKDDAEFDPFSYFNMAKEKALEASATHESWVYICNGQRDSATTTLANYQLGIQNAIDYFLSNNIKVILGFSCYQASTASWYANSGNVAINNILSNYAGSSLVKPGANLYELLGVNVPLQVSAPAHLTTEGYELAGDVVGDALIQAFS